MSSFIKEIEGLYTKPPSPQPSEQPATDGNDGAAAPVAKPLPPPPSGSTATARPTIIRPSKTSAKGAPPPRPAGGPKISSNSTAASLLDMPIPGTQEEPQTMKKSSSASAIGRSQSMRMPPARPTSQPKKKAPAPPRPAPITKGPQKPARSAPVRPNTGTKAKAGAPSLPQRPGPGHPLFKYMVTEPHAIAVFPYNKQNYDELSFEQDDVIILLRKVDDDWMFGRNVDQEGMFPKKFVRVVQALPGERPGRVEGPSAVASYDYDSTAPDDLNFNKGDFIKLLSRCGDDWYRGECNGEVGMFPKTFVEVLEDLPEEKEEVKPDTLSVHQTISFGPRCRARFDFEAEGEEDLDFDEGDIIRLIEPVGEEWMRGELNGKVGIFPLEFVEIIENLPASSIAMATQVDSPPPSASITVTPPTPTADDNLVTALYDFEGTDNTELTFKTGDKIKVTNQVNADWLVGEMYGKSGRFPSNFIDRVPNNLPPVAEDLPAAQSGPHCIAKFDYDGTPPDDLSFKEGDKIMLTERVGADWYKGTCNGQEGMFPKTFVEVVEDLPSDKGAKQSTRQRGGSFEELMPKAEALYDFTGESDGDLSFKAGDTIYLLNKVTDEWYNGELNGKVGQFPVAFVEIIIPLPGPRGL
ncbi:SH3 domain-containing protein 19-like isoform X2 [Ptychodera flava]|uniref:SH3 domain-containing protein 19-like isoform X2 n=1 Tax=Ptychodera flava TaxID=63121 RepID=UPI00396A40FC